MDLNAREDPPTFHATADWCRADFGYPIMILRGRQSSVPTRTPSSDEVEAVGRPKSCYSFFLRIYWHSAPSRSHVYLVDKLRMHVFAPRSKLGGMWTCSTTSRSHIIRSMEYQFTKRSLFYCFGGADLELTWSRPALIVRSDLFVLSYIMITSHRSLSRRD